MNTSVPSDRLGSTIGPGRRHSRRAMLAATAGLAGATILPARAQTLSGHLSIGYDGSLPAISALAESASAEFHTANPDVEIDLRPSPGGSYETALFLALSTGRAADIFIATGLGVGELAAAGLIAPLDTHLATWDGWSQYPETVRGAITYQGQVSGLPTSIDTHFLYYRKDLFEQAGLPRDWRPATPDDILAAARQIESALPDVIPYGLYAGANGEGATAIRGFLPLLYAYGGALKDESGRWIINSPALRNTLTYYQTAFQTDQTVPQQAMTDANPPLMLRDAFVAGELAMIYDGSWLYGEWEAIDPDIAQSQTGYVLFPTADGRPPFAVGAVGNCWYINARSKNKDLAWAQVATGNSAEALVTLNLADPHIPPRADAAADSALQASPFLTAVVESLDALVIAPPDPAYRQLIGVIQNATGIVATGEATPAEAIERYASELKRILGEENVVSQP